jgi:site-specific DNA recombinase
MPAPPRGWQPAVVQLLLTNEAYLGRVHWRGQSYPGLHEPLVDEPTFKHAQALLAERGEDVARRRGNASDFLLSGVVRCGKCKRAYVGMSARGNGGHYHYYACSGRQKLGRTACDGERLNREQLEQAVIAQLLSLYRDGELVQTAVAEAARRQHEQQPALESQQRAIETELRKAERALDRYYEAFESGTLAADRFAERISALQDRLHSVREQEVELGAQLAAEANSAPDSTALAAVADQLELVLNAGSPQKTKALLRLLIHELKVNGRSEILPTYRILTPEVCATPSSVGAPGIEPGTSRV